MKKILTILLVVLVVLLRVDQAFANDNTQYRQSEATIRVNGVIGPAQDPEGKPTYPEGEPKDPENKPVKSEGQPSGLPVTGVTMANMSVVGFGLLLLAGVTVCLKRSEKFKKMSG